MSRRYDKYDSEICTGKVRRGQDKGAWTRMRREAERIDLYTVERVVVNGSRSRKDERNTVSSRQLEEPLEERLFDGWRWRLLCLLLC